MLAWVGDKIVSLENDRAETVIDSSCLRADWNGKRENGWKSGKGEKKFSANLRVDSGIWILSGGENLLNRDTIASVEKLRPFRKNFEEYLCVSPIFSNPETLKFFYEILWKRRILFQQKYFQFISNTRNS